MLFTVEIVGTLLAAFGFLALSEGFYLYGFILGVLSCTCLIPVLYKKELIPMVILQLFFLCVNLNGITNNI